MATHSGVLAWRIPRTGEPGGLLSMGVAQSQTQLKRFSSGSSSSRNKVGREKRRNGSCARVLGQLRGRTGVGAGSHDSGWGWRAAAGQGQGWAQPRSQTLSGALAPTASSYRGG